MASKKETWRTYGFIFIWSALLIFIACNIYINSSKGYREQVFLLGVVTVGMPVAIIISFLLHYGYAIAVYSGNVKFHVDKKPLILLLSMIILTSLQGLIGYRDFIWWEPLSALGVPYSRRFVFFDIFLISFFLAGYFVLFSLPFFYKPTKEHMREKFFSVQNAFLLFPLFSFEFILSDIIKPKHVHLKQLRSNAVRRMNQLNLSTSIVISFFVFLFVTKTEGLPHYDSWAPREFVLCGTILVRTLARGCEIIFAFLNDAISKEKHTTNIGNAERIGLAISSLIEIIVLFAAVYWALEPSIKSVSDSVFYSFGLGTLLDSNFSEMCLSTNIISVFQLITCMVLILLSLARYINDIREDNPSNTDHSETPSISTEKNTKTVSTKKKKRKKR